MLIDSTAGQIGVSNTYVYVRDAQRVLGVVSVTNELLRDAGIAISEYIDAAFDRALNPWRYPDARVFPTISLFPRWDRLVARYQAWCDRHRDVDHDEWN